MAAPVVRIRRVRSVDELHELFDAIARQWDPPLALDRRLEEPLARFVDDRPLMLCVLREGGTLGGGAIAFRKDHGGCILRSIGVDVDLRQLGIGRRLVEILELEAMTLGALSIGLGAADEARGFYDRLGYSGSRVGRSKQLPRPGRVLEYRLAKARAKVGDLDAGIEVRAH